MAAREIPRDRSRHPGPGRKRKPGAGDAIKVASPMVEVAGCRPRSRRGGVVLASVLVFCILILSAQVPARARRGSLLQAWILTATTPLALGVANVSRTMTGIADSVGDLFSTRSENLRLKNEIVE